MRQGQKPKSFNLGIGYGKQLRHEHAYGVYDTINGEWSGTWFNSRKEAAEWVQTQDDKATETGEDWTDGEIYTVMSTTDDEDVIF